MKTVALGDRYINSTAAYDGWLEAWNTDSTEYVEKDSSGKTHEYVNNLPEYRLFYRRIGVIEANCKIRALKSELFVASTVESTPTAPEELRVVQTTSDAQEVTNGSLIGENEFKLAIASAYADEVHQTLGSYILIRHQLRNLTLLKLFTVCRIFLTSAFLAYVLLTYSVWYAPDDLLVKYNSAVQQVPCYRVLPHYLAKKLKNLRGMTTEYHRDVSILVVDFNGGRKTTELGDDDVIRLRAAAKLLVDRKKLFNVTEVETMMSTHMFISG